MGDESAAQERHDVLDSRADMDATLSKVPCIGIFDRSPAFYRRCGIVRLAKVLGMCNGSHYHMTTMRLKPANGHTGDD